MTVLLRKLFSARSVSLLKRNFHLTARSATYEGDGKTTVTILNKNYDYGLMIDNVSEQGFELNNGIRTIGPMIIFPKTMMSWNIATSADMNEESFSLLLNLEPKLDIVVIGLDDEYPYNAPFLLNIKDIFKKHEIPLEILPVHRACSTFNFCNSESRYAAGALVPPKVRCAEDLIKLGRAQRESLEKGEMKKSVPELKIETDEDPLPYAYHDHESQSEFAVSNRKREEELKVRMPWRPEDDKKSSYIDVNTSKPRNKKK